MSLGGLVPGGLVIRVREEQIHLQILGSCVRADGLSCNEDQSPEQNQEHYAQDRYRDRPTHCYDAVEVI